MEDFNDYPDQRRNNFSQIKTKTCGDYIGTTNCVDADDDDDIWGDFDYAVELGAKVREKDRLERAARMASSTFAVTQTPAGKPLLTEQTHEGNDIRSIDASNCNTAALTLGNVPANNDTFKDVGIQKDMVLGYSAWQISVCQQGFEENAVRGDFSTDGSTTSMTPRTKSKNDAKAIGKGFLKSDEAIVEFTPSGKPSLYQNLTDKDVTTSCSYDSGYGSTVGLKKDVNVPDGTCSEQKVSSKYNSVAKELYEISTKKVMPDSDFQDKGASDEFSLPYGESNKNLSQSKDTHYNLFRQDLLRVKRMEEFRDIDAIDSKVFQTLPYRNSTQRTKGIPSSGLRFSINADLPKSTLDKRQTPRYHKCVHQGSQVDNGQVARHKNTDCDRPSSVNARRQRPLSPHLNGDPTAIKQWTYSDTDPDKKSKKEPKWMSQLRHESEFRDNCDRPRTAVGRMSPRPPGLMIDERLITRSLSRKSSPMVFPGISEHHFESQELLTRIGIPQKHLPGQCPSENDLLAEIEQQSDFSSTKYVPSIPNVLTDKCKIDTELADTKLSIKSVGKQNQTNDIPAEGPPNNTSVLPSDGLHKDQPVSKDSATFVGLPKDPGCEMIQTADAPLKHDASTTSDPQSTSQSTLRSSQTMLNVSDLSKVKTDNSTSFQVNISTAMLDGSDGNKTADFNTKLKAHSRVIEVLPASSITSTSFSNDRPARRKRFKERIWGGLRRFTRGARSLIRTFTSCSR